MIRYMRSYYNNDTDQKEFIFQLLSKFVRPLCFLCLLLAKLINGLAHLAKLSVLLYKRRSVITKNVAF